MKKIIDKNFPALFLIALTCVVGCKEEKVVPVTSITLNEHVAELVVGENIMLKEIVLPENATVKAVDWTSSNPAVAHVKGGMITAVAKGEATITATSKDGNYADHCAVTVIGVGAVTLNHDELLINEGDEAILTATVNPVDATDQTVLWTSSNQEVAIVTAEGVVTAVGPGISIITASAKDGGRNATCRVTVNIKMQLTTSASGEVTLMMAGSGSATINWGDGTSVEVHELSPFRDIFFGVQQQYKHRYSEATEHVISIQSHLMTHLYCANMQLSAMDVSRNTSLKYLVCKDNRLTAIDVSRNTAMAELNCVNNLLSALDVSQNAALQTLNCHNNQLTDLNLSQNTALAQLICSANQLSALNISQNAALAELTCSENQLTTLNISQNAALADLYCENNQLVALDVSQNAALINLYCSGNQLSTLDVSHNAALKYLECFNNSLSAIDVNHNAMLVELSCENNRLTQLAMNAAVALKALNCANNLLRTIDVSQNAALTEFLCYGNRLFALDVGHNAALKSMDCRTNELVTLNLNGAAALSYLNCDNNFLQTLNVSQNPALTSLYCINNQLSALDVTANTALTLLDCRRNTLDAASLETLFATLHPNAGEKKLFIAENPGTATCNTLIAEEKGWKLNE